MGTVSRRTLSLAINFQNKYECPFKEEMMTGNEYFLW